MSWMLFPSSPVLSALVLFLVALPFLYAARTPVHGLFRTLIRAVAQPLRLAARWLSAAATEMKRRNEMVLLAHGREETAQAVEREFERVTAIVRRDLQGYPALQRRLLDELTHIEEDYKKCGEVPPPPPEWTKAVKTMSEIKQTGDGLVQKILVDISESIDKIYDKVLNEYRHAYRDRHKILEGFLPFWRSLEQTLARVDKSMTGLNDSADKIDAQMEKYEQIAMRSETATNALAASVTKEFVIAGVVLAIAVLGGLVNFLLISEPMSAMVSAGKHLAGGLKAADVAALVLILLETTAGLFLMEALRITHLFPRIHNLPDNRRHIVLWASGIFLFVLAGFEMALAVMRDMLIAADMELKRGLSDTVTTAPPVDPDWVKDNVPIAGQMILGFVLPFLLAFAAIPFEYFVSSSRIVFGRMLVFLTRALGFLCRVLSNLMRHVATSLILLYDVVIFLPVLIERAVKGARSVPRAEDGFEGSVRTKSDYRKAG